MEKIKKMKKLIEVASQHFENVPDLLRERKLLVWSFFIVATVFMIFGIARTKFDMTVEGWFQQDDPLIVAFNGFHAQFGSEDNLYIAYKPKDGDVFSAKSLEAVKGIREELLNYRSKLKEGEDSALKHIVKVNTLINAPVLTAQDDSLISKKLVGKTVPTSYKELDEIRRTAESEPKFSLYYFSKDQKYGGINIETDFGAIPMDSDSSAGKDLNFGNELKMDDMSNAGKQNITEKPIRYKRTDVSDYVALMRAVKVILNKPEYANHLDYYPVGYTASMEYDLKNVQELGLINLAALIVMTILLLFLFRSFSAVAWSITIVVLTTIWTIGIAGWLGIIVSPFIMLTIMLILTIGMADAIHILSGYMFFRNNGDDHKTALRTSYRKAGTACLLTAITNMVGLLALNLTPIVPIRVFAMMSAGSIVLALLFTIYLLPLLIDLWAPMKVDISGKSRLSALIDKLVPNFSHFLGKLLEKVLPLAEKRRYFFISVFVVCFGVCMYGATMLKVNTNPIEQFPKGSKIRENVSTVDQKMTGAQNMEIYMDLGKENSFHDPFVVNIMDELQQKIEKNYSKLVVRTYSLVDVVKDSYQKLNEGRKEMFIIPSDQKVLSQTLFLFNNANSDDRRKLVSDDYSKSHISVQLRSTGSYEYTEAFNLMKKDIDEAVTALKQKYPDTKVAITGILALMMTGVDYITWNEFQDFTVALIIISIILLLVFGSFRAGLIALIPNLIPSVLAFGIMGWLNISLDFSTMMLAPIIIGIAVDDTVHFISLYQADVMAHGDIKKALRHNLLEVGQSITFAALILGLGFGMMSFASNAGTRYVGIFGCLAIFIGLLNDLFLLPALILIFKFKFQAKADQFKIVKIAGGFWAMFVVIFWATVSSWNEPFLPFLGLFVVGLLVIFAVFLIQRSIRTRTSLNLRG